MKTIFTFIKNTLALLLTILGLKLLYNLFIQKNNPITKNIPELKEKAKDKHTEIIEKNNNANKTNKQTPKEHDDQFQKDTEGMTTIEIKKEETANPEFSEDEDEELKDILNLSKTHN